jgi:hypothetical protein
MTMKYYEGRGVDVVLPAAGNEDGNLDRGRCSVTSDGISESRDRDRRRA